MPDRRYTPEYDETPFTYMVKSVIGRETTADPARMAETLESHANALRGRMDDPRPSLKIEPNDHDRLPWAVYSETGEELLFESREDALRYVEEALPE